jgi:hypothetical protein
LETDVIEDIYMRIEALAKAIAEDDEKAGMDAALGLLGGALADLRRVANALERIADEGESRR